MPDPSLYSATPVAKETPKTGKASLYTPTPLPDPRKFRTGLIGGTGSSGYNEGLTNTTDVNALRAANQGFWGEFGNSLAQTTSEIGLGFFEGVGYLGVGKLLDTVTGTEQEVGNSWSNFFREANEKFGKEVVPIYDDPDNSNWHQWFFQNMPSIASSIALMFPAIGATKLIGTAGRVVGGLKLAKKLGVAAEGLKFADTIASAGFSRHMENSMESIETFNGLKEEALQKGLTEEEAIEVARNGSEETYWNNWALIVGDVLQFGIATKSFGAVSRAKSIEEALGALKKTSKVGNLLFQAGTEAAEEGYQYIVAEEAARRAALEGKVREQDYTTYPERLLSYVTNGDFLTSAFFGALGGAVFQQVGQIFEDRSLAQQRLQDNHQKSILEKLTAVYKKDPVSFSKSTDTDIATMIMSGLESGRADQIEKIFNSVKDMDVSSLPEEEQAEAMQAIQRADTALGDLKYLEELFNEIHKDVTKLGDSRLTRFELANRADLRSNKRIYTLLDTNQTEKLQQLSSERNLSSDYSLLLKAITELDILNEFAENAKEEDFTTFEQTTLKEKKEELEKQIVILKDTIRTNNSIDDKTIDKKLKLNNSTIREASLPKLAYELRITQQNKDYDKLQDEAGRKDLSKKLDTEEEKEKERAFNEIVDSITPETSFDNLKKAKEVAKQLDKVEEFTAAYNTKISEFRAGTAKFDPNRPTESLAERYIGNNLLKEHELTNLYDIAVTTGIPESSTFDHQFVGQMYINNPAFATKVDNYFAKVDAITPVVTKDTLGKESTASNPEGSDGNDNTFKQPLQNGNNRRAWLLQGIQFELEDNFKDGLGNEYTKEDSKFYLKALDQNKVEISKDIYQKAKSQFAKPDPSKPAISNVAKKINWDFINSGQLPLDAILHFEYEFEDEWNKSNNGKVASTALFDVVYYKDNNTNNKSLDNRKVVGVLSGYDENRIFESIEAKDQLKRLRDHLFNQVIDSPYKTGILTLNETTKIDRKGGNPLIFGRVWNTNEYKNPLSALKEGQKLVLAIGVINKTGNTFENVLVTNGHSWEKKISYRKEEITPGATYILLEAQNGDIIPYKGFTHKVKEFPGLTEQVTSLFRSIKNANEEQRKKVIDNISSISSILGLTYSGGTYTVKWGHTLTPTYTKLSEEAIPAFVSELEVQMNRSRINKGTYNTDISDAGFITTDLNRGTHFHSTKIGIVPPTFEKVKVKDIKTASQSKETTRPIKTTKVQELQEKLDKILWERAVKSNKYTAPDETIPEDEVPEDEIIVRLITLEDFNKDLEIAVDQTTIGSTQEVLIVEFNSLTYENLLNYIEVENLEGLLSESSRPNLPIEDVEAFEIMKSNIKKVLPELNQLFIDPNQLPISFPSPQEIENKPIDSDPKPIKGLNGTPISLGKSPKTSLYDSSTINYSKINPEEVSKWMQKNLPQVPVSIVDNIIEVYKNGGVKAWGMFHQNAITLYRGAPKGTEHHEAFHAVFNLFLNDKERESILSEAATIYKDGDLEENLADDFTRYIQQQEVFEGKLGYNIKNFFKKLWDFIRSIFTNDINIETLFWRIDTGYYANKPLQRNSSRVKYKVNADPYTRNRNVRMINYYFFEVLERVRDQNSWGNLTDVETLRKINSNPDIALETVYQSVYVDFYETFQQVRGTPTGDELKNLMSDFFEVGEDGYVSNRKDYYMLALRDLARYGINVKGAGLFSEYYNTEDDTEIGENSEEKNNLESWQVNAINTNGKDTLSFNVRKALRRAVEYRKTPDGEFEESTDKFGFKSFINFDEIYNTLENNLAGIYNSDVMMLTLHDLKNHKSEVYGIIEQIENDEGLRTQFFNNFAKAYIPFYQVRERIREGYDQHLQEVTHENIFTVYNANRRNVYQLLIDDWYTNLVSKTNNTITNEDGSIDTSISRKFLDRFDLRVSSIKAKREATMQDIEGLTELAKNFGLDINPESLFIEYTPVTGKIVNGVPIIVTNAFDNLNNVIKDIRTILNAIHGGINPYRGESQETETILRLAKTISRNEPTLHQDSFMDGSSRIHSYTLPTFFHKKIQEYKDNEGRQAYLNNWWYKRNKWLLDLENDESIKDKFEIIVLHSLITGRNKESKRYEEMIDRELDIADINMYINNGSAYYAYYRLPILSDSPLAPYVRHKKYTKEEIVDGFYQLALSEQERINIAKTTDIKIKNWNDEKGNGFKFHFIPELNESDIDLGNEEQSKTFISSWLDQQLEKEALRLKEEGILGDNGFFKSGTISTHNIAKKDLVAEYFYNKVFANAMSLQLTSVDPAFYPNGDIFQKRNAQIMRFTKMMDVNANWNGYHPQPTYTEIYVHDEIVDSKEIGESLKKDLISKGHREDYANQAAALFDSINSTDGYGAHTIDRRKDILVGYEQWTDAHERAYKLIKEGVGWDPSFTLFLGPIKPFYYDHENVGGIIVPVQDKNAEICLIPALTNKHPILKKALNFLQSNSIDAIQFSSVIKVGEYGTASIDNLGEALIHTKNNKYWGIQTEVPQHYLDTDILFGSQPKKLMLSDIPDNAKFFNGTMNKKELFDKYQSLLTNNIIDSYNELTGELQDINSTQKILLQQVIDRNLGEYYESALEIVEDQQGEKVFNLPLFFPIHARRFENIISSIVRKKVTKQRINGGNFALASSFGLSERLKIVRKEDGGIDYMEVMLPFWMKSKFARLPNGEIDIEYIKDQAPELLDLFVYFMPTEAKYSTARLRVVGFTPDLMGGIMMLPHEIVEISGKDFDIDKGYVMFPNFEVIDGEFQKIRYDLNKIETLNKKQRDNAIQDILKEIWSNSSISDQVLTPGGFETLKNIAESFTPIDHNANPILPSTQMEYFTRNSNGSKLLSIAVNHKGSQAILQFSNIELAREIVFDRKKRKSLHEVKDLNNRLISSNLAEFVAAFADNAKYPVANRLNLNRLTFDTTTLILKVGYDLNTSLSFTAQPVLKEYSKRYFREGGNKASETTVFNDLVRELQAKLPESDRVKSGVHFLDTVDLVRSAHLFYDINMLSEDAIRQQLQVLYSFKEYKELSDSESKLIRGLRADTIGASKTMAGNTAFLSNIESSLKDKNLVNVQSAFDNYPLIDVSIEYGIRKPQNEILNKFFPYGEAAYTNLYDNFADIKGENLTEWEINTINNQTLAYFLSNFDFFNEDTRGLFLTDFPEHFSKVKDQFEEHEIVKYLRFVPKSDNVLIDRIEMASPNSVGNEQRELITRSWEAMLQSDDTETSKFARSLVKYAYFTTGFSFIPSGYGHLVPPTYIDKLVDSQGINIRDHLYKLLEESKDSNLFSQNFIDQLLAHNEYPSLIRTLNRKSVTNYKVKKNINVSLLLSPQKSKDAGLVDKEGNVVSKYFIMYSKNGIPYTYKFSGYTSTDDLVYNVLEPRGYNGLVFEYNKYETRPSVLSFNILELTEKDTFPINIQDIEGDDVKYQLENNTDTGTKPDKELNDTLKKYLTSYGVSVKAQDVIFTKTRRNARAVADLTNKVIRIAKGKETRDTLPEETGHFIEAVNRGTEWHNRLMQLVPRLPIYQDVLQEYEGQYGEPEDYVRESIGQLIGKGLISNYQTESRGITDSIKRILERLWNKFISIFKNVDEYAIRNEVDGIIGKISKDVLSESYVGNKQIKLGGKFYELSGETETKEQKILREGIESINKKIKIYKRKALSEFSAREQKLLDNLIEQYNDKQYKKGLYDYVLNAASELRKIEERFEKINRTPESLEDKRKTIITLKSINNYVNGFKDTLDGIVKENVFNGKTREDKLVRRFIAEVSATTNRISTEYFNIGKPILVDILKNFSTNPNLNIASALNVLEKDISYTQRWLDAMAEASDSILNIVDVMVKDAKHRARFEILELSKKLLETQKKLEKAGQHSTNFMYKRTKAGKLTGYIVQKYDMGKWKKDRNEAMEKIDNDSGLRPHDRAKAKDKWFSDHTQPNPDKEQIIDKKKVEFEKEFPNNLKLAQEKFEEWLSYNTRKYTSVDPETGEFAIKYIKELVIPTDDYLSEQYAEVQKNIAQKAYYDEIINIINHFNEVMPSQYRLGRLAPQLRKDYIERLFVVDKDGKRKLKGIPGVLKESKTTLAEQLIRHENDIEFGLTDESGKPIDQVPVYYTRKLDNFDNLSTDMTSALLAYASSAINYKELSRVVDVIEFTKDVIGEREVLSGKVDPVSIFKKKEDKGKPIKIKGIESKAYGRLIDYMNMVIFNKQKKEEGTFGSVDRAKLADFVNTYTSLNSLALNIYAAISNVTVGNANVRMEAVANEFVSNKDLFKADSIYAFELPKVIGNIGQRLDDSKLGLWIEYMDTLQDFARETRNIDAGRNTVFSRLMKTSSLYFLNHAGEHLIQGRMSLALAVNTKVKDNLGNIMTLWDAFDVKDNRLVLKEGIKKVGQKGTGLFREDEDGQELTQRDIIRFINRQNFLNKRLHGIYNDIDKSATQQYALSRMAILFRKFIKPGWNRRFAWLTYNEEGETHTEGYYTSVGRFIKNMYSDLKKAEFSIGKQWGNLESFEKKNFLRFATEWAFITAAATAATVLTNLGDDDEENYMLNLAAYEAYRMYSELRFFSSITETIRILKSPLAAINQVQKISRFIRVWEWSKEVERGKYKGLTRFEVGAVELLPFAGTYTNFRTPEEQLRFYTNTGISPW